MRPSRSLICLGTTIAIGVAVIAPGAGHAHATTSVCTAGIRVEATSVDCVLPPGATITLIVKSGNGGSGGAGGSGGRGGDYRFFTGSAWIVQGVGGQGGVGGAGGSGGAGAKESITWTNVSSSPVTLRLTAPSGTGTTGAPGTPGAVNGPGSPNSSPLAGGAGGAGTIGASASGTGGAGGPGGQARDLCCGSNSSSDGGAGGAGGAGAAGTASQVMVVENSLVLLAPTAGGGGSGGSGGLGGVGATLFTSFPSNQPAGAAGSAGISPPSALATSSSETPHVEITSVVLPVIPAASVNLELDPREGACTVRRITGLASTWAALPTASECTREGWILRGWLPRGGSSAFAPGAFVQLSSDNVLAAVWEQESKAPASSDIAVAGVSRPCPVVWSSRGEVRVGTPASLSGHSPVIVVVAPGGIAEDGVTSRARALATDHGGVFLGVVPARAWKAPRILASC